MKKFLVSTFAIAIVISLSSSCGLLKKDVAKSGSNAELFKTTMDTVSYLIGQEIGSSFKTNYIDISSEALLKGVMDAVAGKTDLFTEEVKNDVMTTFQHRLQMAEMERREKVSAENRQEQETFMAQNRKNPLIQQTASGIQYKVIIPGNGEKPLSTDTVRVHYEGRFVTGEVFDASRNHGINPVEFPLNRVISGWTEALQLMPVGSTYELYIPAELGYGERGNDRIPPAKMLIFTVELIGIVKK